MSLLARFLVAWLLLSLAVHAEPVKVRKAPTPPKNLTQDFVDADLVEVIKVLGGSMNRNTYVGPTVKGVVNASFVDTPALEALELILGGYPEFEYRLLDGPNSPVLVVAVPECEPECVPELRVIPEGSVRQAFVLENAPSARMVDFLSGQYPQVLFAPHQTLNGFWATGSDEDLLKITDEVQALDRPFPPPKRIKRSFRVKHSDLDEARALLALVPDVEYSVNTRRRLLVMVGSEGAIDQALELLRALNHVSEATWFLE